MGRSSSSPVLSPEVTGGLVAETVESLRWRIFCSVDGETYRRLYELCAIHRVDLADLLPYLLSVGLALSANDLRVVAEREIPPVLN